MNNIKYLEIFSDGIPPNFFQGCPSSLHASRALLYLPQASPRNHISQFLASQPDLKSLLLDWRFDPFSDTCCTKLEVLCGDCPTIENPLPGRNAVRHLEWITYGDDDEDLSTSLPIL